MTSGFFRGFCHVFFPSLAEAAHVGEVSAACSCDPKRRRQNRCAFDPRGWLFRSGIWMWVKMEDLGDHKC